MNDIFKKKRAIVKRSATIKSSMDDTDNSIPLAPVPKPRMTRSDKWKKRPAVVRYFEFKDAIRAVYPYTLGEQLDVIFHVPMPKSWSANKRYMMDGQPHQQKPDVDNYLKALLDCLCEDDSYIHDVRARKVWGYDGSIEFRSKQTYTIRERE